MPKPRPPPDALSKILETIETTPAPKPPRPPRPRKLAEEKHPDNDRPEAPAIDPKWFTVEKLCRHCGEVKNVGRDFGVINRRGLVTAAGWCKACRSATNYHSQPRKYRTKNNP